MVGMYYNVEVWVVSRIQVALRVPSMVQISDPHDSQIS